MFNLRSISQSVRLSDALSVLCRFFSFRAQVNSETIHLYILLYSRHGLLSPENATLCSRLPSPSPSVPYHDRPLGCPALHRGVQGAAVLHILLLGIVQSWNAVAIARVVGLVAVVKGLALVVAHAIGPSVLALNAVAVAVVARRANVGAVPVDGESVVPPLLETFATALCGRRRGHVNYRLLQLDVNMVACSPVQLKLGQSSNVPTPISQSRHTF